MTLGTREFPRRFRCVANCAVKDTFCSSAFRSVVVQLCLPLVLLFDDYVFAVIRCITSRVPLLALLLFVLVAVILFRFVVCRFCYQIICFVCTSPICNDFLVICCNLSCYSLPLCWAWVLCGLSASTYSTFLCCHFAMCLL